MRIGSQRRSLRRALALDCSVASERWDGSLPLFTSDVSHEGLWVDTWCPLAPGDEVTLAFAPPGARPFEDVWALAEVARVAAGGLGEPAGMGLAFTYLNAVDRRFLVRSLVGHPPRLPRRRALPPPLPRRPPPLPKRLTLADVTFLDVPGDELVFTPQALSALLTGSAPLSARRR